MTYSPSRSRFRKTLLALTIASLLSACGGGGSSDDDTQADTSLSGTAAKGIIIQGLVTAAELNSDKTVKNANVGTATTDNEGSYSLTLNGSYTGGPVKVSITATSSTRMVCDATSGCGTRTDSLTDPNGNNSIDFGEEYQPQNLNMSALLPSASNGESITVQITPFTDLAAQRALSAGVLDDTVIESANSEVSNLLGGIDILNTPPVDITDPSELQDASPTQETYAALLAAIAELAPDDGNGQPDIEAALTALANDFAADGTFSASDTANDPNTIALAEIIQEANDALQQVGAADTSGVLNTLQDDVAAAGSGDIDPQPSPNAGDDNITKTKAFLADLRTWGVTIGNELDTPAQAFNDQIDLADQTREVLSSATREAIDLGISAIIDFRDGSISSLNDFVDASGSNPFTVGTLSSGTGTAGTEFHLQGATVNVGNQTVSLDMTLVAPDDGSNVTSFSFGVVSILAESSMEKIVVSSGSIDVVLEQATTIDFANDAPLPIDTISLDFEATLTQKMVLDGAGAPVTATDPVSFTGTVTTTLYPYIDAQDRLLSALPGSFSLGGTFSNTSGSSYDMNLTISLDNAATAQPVNTLLPLGSTYADNNNGEHLVEWSYSTVNGQDRFDYSDPYYQYSAVYVVDGSGNAYVDISQIWHGYAENSILPTSETSLVNYITNYGFQDSSPYSVEVSGQGTYLRDNAAVADFSTGGFISYTLDEHDIVWFDDQNPATGDIGLQFEAQFPNLPAATISFTGDVTGLDEGTATMTIAYGSRQLVFSGSKDATNGEQVSLTITNQDGVTLTAGNLVNLGTGTADITINGVTVATITELGNGSIKVEYNDGTFEIF